MNDLRFDPNFDLVLTRDLDLSPAEVWRAWTTPDLLKRWFCPKPWRTVECDIELRPGGRFRTVMHSPDGKVVNENVGCCLEITENRRLIWTSGLGPEFRPRTVTNGFAMTAVIDLAPHGRGTRYTALARHANAEDRATHEKMGFEMGWGIALDQLIEVMTT